MQKCKLSYFLFGVNDNMSRGKKTSPEMVYKIMTSWAVTNNLKETAKNLDIPVSTVKSIVDNNKDKPEFVKLRNEKMDEFSAKASGIINKALKRLERDIEDDEKDIPINHLTTVIGTLFDKKALCDGNATEKVAIEVKLPPGVEDYAK